MATKTIELDYTPELNRKIIHKAGVPGDNLPDNLMQFMCKHYENDTIIIGKRILVIRMLDLAKQYAVKNTVTYFTDNKEKYDEFLKVINNGEKFGGDDSVEFVDDWTKLGEVLKDMPKFDIVIGNPPYEGKGNPLYLQILEKVNINDAQVVWLCPSQWVKSYKDSTYLNNVKTNTCKNLIEHYHISNPFNDAIVANEIGIYIFGDAKQYEDYNEIRWERFNNIILAKNICKKLKVYKDNLKNHVITDNSEEKTGFWVNNSRIRGSVHKSKPRWDWTTLFGQKQHNNFKFDKNPRWNHWQFNSVVECKNFISSTETDICMFAYYITKLNNNCCPVYFELIPWLGDYTHEWTEEAIAKELNLTQEEVDYIHEEMKNFGWKASPKNKG